jgi:hypothetical protein
MNSSFESRQGTQFAEKWALNKKEIILGGNTKFLWDKVIKKKKNRNFVQGTAGCFYSVLLGL